MALSLLIGMARVDYLDSRLLVFHTLRRGHDGITSDERHKILRHLLWEQGG